VINYGLKDHYLCTFTIIQIIRRIVHPKIKNPIIIYWHSCCNKLVWLSFFCWRNWRCLSIT